MVSKKKSAQTVGLTQAQRDALLWLRKNGRGVLNSTGDMLSPRGVLNSTGDMLSPRGDYAPFMRRTVYALRDAGRVRFEIGSGKQVSVYLTPEGEALCLYR